MIQKKYIVFKIYDIICYDDNYNSYIPKNFIDTPQDSKPIDKLYLEKLRTFEGWARDGNYGLIAEKAFKNKNGEEIISFRQDEIPLNVMDVLEKELEKKYGFKVKLFPLK